MRLDATWDVKANGPDVEASCWEFESQLATNEDIVSALKGRYGDHQLAAAYRSQLKARTHLSGVSLNEIAADVQQLAHQARVG
jgi:hypothetical protein